MKAKIGAAALAMLGLPGMRFLHEGQLTGARIKVPVQLGRRPVEPVQPDVQQAYASLLAALKKSTVGQGTGQLLAPRPAWEGNPTHQNFIVVYWSGQNSSGKVPFGENITINLRRRSTSAACAARRLERPATKGIAAAPSPSSRRNWRRCRVEVLMTLSGQLRVKLQCSHGPPRRRRSWPTSVGCENRPVQTSREADRSDPRLAERYDWLSPAILRFLRRVAREASEAGVPVRVCGEMGDARSRRWR